MSGDVGAVVVNYNACEHLLDWLGSLVGEEVAEVVVVDNGSLDASQAALAQQYPQARWVPTGANIGYGRAANAGAALAGGEYLLVSNPDVVLRPGAVAAMRAYLEGSPAVGLVGPRIVGTDGQLYPSARRFPDLLEALAHAFLGQFWPGNPFSRRYRMTGWDHSRPREVDWVSGACFMARRQAWDDVGGFDPAYFMYMEDVDLCWRLRLGGWAVAYEPAAEVVHVQGVSADRHPYRMLLAHHVSMWRFARRTAGGRRRWVLVLVGPGLAARLLVTMARRAASGRKPAARAAGWSTGVSSDR